MNILRKITGISAKIWLVLFIAAALVCVFALRHNNQEMIKLRSAVYAADKNDGNVNAALNNLRSYVYAHMNTDLSSGGNNIKPPIQLKYTYQRLVLAKEARLQTASQTIYNNAAAHCRASISSTLDTDLLACIQNYAVRHGISTGTSAIPVGLYEFDFVSPSWSPDLAGWSLVAAVIFLAAFIIRFIFNRLAGYKK